MKFDIESLGFSQEELQERVISKICETLLSSIEYDPEDGEEYPVASKFKNAIEARIKKQVDETINALAEKYVLPNVSAYIETLTLQQTNQWGEKQHVPVTFIEYLVKRAENYLQEKVSYDGKTKEESGGYSWNGTQTRVTHLIHVHLQHSIKIAMESALKVANNAIAGGIESAVKIKLGEITEKLKVEVKV
jgi:hypothetical protein